MGLVKQYWLETELEKKDEWIRDQLDDDSADEYSEGWAELSLEYDINQEGLYEAAELEAEYQWYKSHTYPEFYERFVTEITNLRDLLEGVASFSHQEAHHKMIYAHTVTLLESFLGDTIKSLVVSNELYLANAVKEINELKIVKPTLEEILTQDNIVLNKTLKWLSGLMFHNIAKVIRIYESALKVSIKIDLEPVGQIATIRHDIVHRNGKTTEGNIITIDKNSVINAIDVIESFVKEFQVYINESWALTKKQEELDKF